MHRRLLAALMAVALSFPVVAVSTPSSTAAATEGWPAVFDPFVLQTLNIQMTSQDWDFIRKDLTETYRPAQFWADGEAPILVAVRRKSSRALPSESNPIKVGLKVDINEYVDGQLWHGLNKLSLENGADSGVLEEGLAWSMHRMSGAPANGYAAAYGNWARVNVNGAYIGLYVSAEQRDKQALRQRDLWDGGETWLYEQDLSATLLEEGDPNSPAFMHLCYSPFRGKGKGSCATPADPALEADLQAWLDMDAFLTLCATEALTGNTDGMCAKGHNAFFVDFSEARMATGLKRFYMPWDLDTVFGSTQNNNIYGMKGGRRVTQGPYEAIILNDKVFRAQYNTKILALTDATTGALSLPAVSAFLDQLGPVLAQAMAQDPYASANAAARISALKAWLTERIDSARAQAIANANPVPRP